MERCFGHQIETSSVHPVLPVSVSQRRELWYCLLRLFEYCRTSTDLTALKILKESELEPLQLVNRRIGRKYTYAYHSAYINTFINCNQIFEALDTFHDIVDTLLNDGVSFTEVVLNLPTKRLVHFLVHNKAWDELCSLLEEIYEHKGCAGQLDIDDSWVQFLQGAVTGNHYGLCKLLTDHYIMKKYGNNNDDDLFGSNLSELCDGLVMLILQVLSRNGDVMSTISVIETFYLHKNMRGERGLTKDLSIDIIRAYCTFHDPNSEDDNMFPILDVINKFVVRFGKINIKLSYKDIGDLLSSRFFHYCLGLELEQTQLNPNKHLDGHLRGNPFANLLVLEKFITTHVQRMIDNNFESTTLTLFVNCVLNHVSTHQNLTGVIKVLSSLHQTKIKQSSILDPDLYLIIVHALGKSSTSKYSSAVLYKHLVQNDLLLPSHMKDFILSSIRLTYGQPLSWISMTNLQFFFYQYLSHVDGEHVDMYVRDILENLLSMIELESSLRQTIEYVLDLEKVDINHVNDHWHNEGLLDQLQSINSMVNQELNQANLHMRDIDLRDAKRLERILS
ncbi:uncharacterized protein KQ657_004195 [Scheffersomyces spartinae]|uniref:Uncharacterized protein n=1 Tax=Scheffersomyces spartinae TaxID=45513 RepID=A0A9P7VBT2_9ASCO|nr:uncharacterized protein KQ657_004195 [Scheffersomyces spartinae]KAG7195079.1 hypothetical protein KQ657_004195 [Scheffersomyces spartinae]